MNRLYSDPLTENTSFYARVTLPADCTFPRFDDDDFFHSRPSKATGSILSGVCWALLAAGIGWQFANLIFIGDAVGYSYSLFTDPLLLLIIPVAFACGTYREARYPRRDWTPREHDNSDFARELRELRLKSGGLESLNRQSPASPPELELHKEWRLTRRGANPQEKITWRELLSELRDVENKWEFVGVLVFVAGLSFSLWYSQQHSAGKFITAVLLAGAVVLGIFGGSSRLLAILFCAIWIFLHFSAMGMLITTCLLFVAIASTTADLRRFSRINDRRQEQDDRADADFLRSLPDDIKDEAVLKRLAELESQGY